MFEISDFDILCNDVKRCIKCSRMCESQRVLNRSAGSLKAKIMFIGEAPGRLGADSSGIPFHGDKAGHNFESLLNFVGISREDVFVTNAVLCNPKDENGNNATPSVEELKNCSGFLKRQIDIVNPSIIVTLGAKSLQALSMIEGHALNLKENVRTTHRWYGRVLIPAYHPGQRAMLHRSMANQRSDYQFIAEYLRKLNKPSTKQYGSTLELTVAVINYLLNKKSSINYFALHKLYYLIEYNNFLSTGSRMTTAYFVRQKDGPYCTDLHIQKLKKAIPDLHVKSFNNGTLILSMTSSLFDSRNDYLDFLDQQEIAVIDQVLSKYGNLSLSNLKQAVYMTRPMRNILFVEKNGGINLYNSPINFSTESNYLVSQ